MPKPKSASSIRYKSKGSRGGTSESSKYRAKRLRDAASKGKAPTRGRDVKIGKNPSVAKEVAKAAGKTAIEVGAAALVSKGVGHLAKAAKTASKVAKAKRAVSRSKEGADWYHGRDTAGARRFMRRYNRNEPQFEGKNPHPKSEVGKVFRQRAKAQKVNAPQAARSPGLNREARQVERRIETNSAVRDVARQERRARAARKRAK